MAVVLQVAEFVGVHLGGGEPASWGDYLEWYDPDAHDGRGEARFTPDVERALRFESGGEALKCWRAQSTLRPLRPDGKPNRPLTAYSMMTAVIP